MAAEPRTGVAKVRSGRRPGRPDTRASILQAAKTEFAVKGFDRATVRSIASTAGVDAALVHHYSDRRTTCSWRRLRCRSTRVRWFATDSGWR